jgi:tRNA1Val (adenine37-N6)-methyltransferase
MSLFHFKEFIVDQSNCPMKINTDGVLLGAMANINDATKILDIGTGTGVIALMLAQRNREAEIDALDIDLNAFERAQSNFENSIFHNKLKAFHFGFKEYFDVNPLLKYDLIVSNPPFFLNALPSPNQTKNLARHTDVNFFTDLIQYACNHLNPNGILEMVLPLDISQMLQNIAGSYQLYLIKCVEIKSFDTKAPFRHVVSFSRKNHLENITKETFCIYEAEGIHSLPYKKLLKNFFKIF